MSTPLLNIYASSIRSTESTTPAMIDEMSLFSLVSDITGIHMISYEDIIDASLSYIHIYEIPEDKKEFSIEVVRKCISDIDLMPYSWKNIFILREFRTATLGAQNALLKSLEECPAYAVILMEVENTNILLETIRSRSINLVETYELIWPTLIVSDIVRLYQQGDHVWIARMLHDNKSTSREAIEILRWVYPYLSSVDMLRCDSMIDSLATTHENPRSLLDLFFLYNIHT